MRRVQKEKKVKELKLLQNVKTRWNSDYYMTERFVECKVVLTSALQEIDRDLPEFARNDWLIGY